LALAKRIKLVFGMRVVTGQLVCITRLSGSVHQKENVYQRSENCNLLP